MNQRKRQNLDGNRFRAQDRFELECDKRVKATLREIYAHSNDVPRSIGRMLNDEVRPLGKLPSRLVAMHRSNRPLADVHRLLDEIRDVVDQHLYHEPRRDDRIA